MKRIAIVPTLCTLGNACCGFASIVYAAQFRQDVDPKVTAEYMHFFAISGWLIFAAMIFDMLDGYLARLSRTASNFGVQLDSLCDVISFGVAPGFLLIRLGSGIENRMMWDALLVIATLYMICAILRLARFNVYTSTDAKSHRSFLGLPSPAAAGCVASLAVMRYDVFDKYPWLAEDAVVSAVIHWVAPIGALAVALLMVSRVPYAHVAGRILGRRRHNFGQLMQLIVAVFAVILIRELALVLVFWLYAIIPPVRALVTHALHREAPQAVTSP